jgi:hypothetical protein
MAKLKRENKELKQQLEFIRKSSETLKVRSIIIKTSAV